MLRKIFITAVFLLTMCNAALSNDELPILDRSDNLTGVDDNQNGIRDDIEKYIVENYSDEGHRKAMLQYAKTMQASLLVNTSDKIAVKQASIQRSKASHCIFLKFDVKKGDENPSITWNKIRSMTTNTKVRLKAYLDFDEALVGMAFALPQGDTCE